METETDFANDKNRNNEDDGNIGSSSSSRSNNPATTVGIPVVRVGVGVLVKDPKDPTRVYCGIRKGSHGAGTLALPG